MKIICVGRNYADHAKELKNEVPTEPVIFMKPKSALLPQGKALYYPEFTEDLHYECELVVKITGNGKYIQEKFAHKYYGEVSLGIDFTARDLQDKQKKKGLPWEIAKAFDNSAVIGKFISFSEIKNIHDLNFCMYLNKKVAQNGNTKDMIYSIETLISFISKYFTLQQGDLIYTGTPVGVGSVKQGDKLEAFIENESLLEFEVK